MALPAKIEAIIESYPQEAKELARTIYASMQTVPNEALKSEVIGYILRQLNQDTMRGYVKNTIQYKHILLNAYKGLFRLIYLYDYEADTFQKTLAERDALFYSAMYLVMLLMTRPYQGNDYKLLLEEMKAKQPIMLNPNPPR